MTACPFQVGDRIHELQESLVIPLTPMTGETGAYQLVPDPCRPDATVTEITPEGFVYEYDVPVHMGRPFWGEMTGGTCFPEGYAHWRLIS